MDGLFFTTKLRKFHRFAFVRGDLRRSGDPYKGEDENLGINKMQGIYIIPGNILHMSYKPIFVLVQQLGAKFIDLQGVEVPGSLFFQPAI